MIRANRKVLTEEQVKAFRTGEVKQVLNVSAPKSADPEHYPVFDIPLNKKVRIYVPNHVALNEQGVPELRMDKYFAHNVRKGNRYDKIRCVSGLEHLGYTGCPLCEGRSTCFELANYEIDASARSQGLNPKEKDDERIRSLRQSTFSKMVIGQPIEYYTFPIVVLESEDVPSNGGRGTSKMKILADSDDPTMPSYKIYWYTTSKGAYEKKWLETLAALADSMDVEIEHPGGQAFVLDYTSKSENPNKRDVARDMTVRYKPFKKKVEGDESKKSSIDYEKFMKKMDELTKDWDPVKAIETIYANMLFEQEDLQKEADEILATTNDKLVLYQNQGSSVVGGLESKNLDALGAFGEGKKVTGALVDNTFDISSEVDDED